MKRKILHRLIVYFAVVLLVFAAISGTFFSALFAQHTVRLSMQDLEAHTASIAETVSHFVQSYCAGNCEGGGFKAYMRYIADVSMSNLYLVDANGDPVTLNMLVLSEEPLPADMLPVVSNVFATGMADSVTHTTAFRTGDLISAAPIMDAEDNVLYVLLLHSNLDEVTHASEDGIRILSISLSVAMLLAIIVSVFLSRRLVRPLHQMKDATTRMMEGCYGARTGVSQQDEIGVLAGHIDELSAQLQAVEQERAQMEQMRRDFLSDIAHELRTPIAVVRGSVEVLCNGMAEETEARKRYYDQLNNDTHHLQRIVNDMLDYTRLQSTQFSMDMACVNLTDVLKDSARSMKQVADVKNISFGLTVGETPVPVFGDYGRLRQMITILLDNAVKFSPPGADVQLTCLCEGDVCRVCVTDHGVGMSQETIEHIFDRYFHSRTAANRTGTGLGLPIAREIARRHQCDIRCESTPGQGTCFTLTFPLCDPPYESL